MEERLIRLEQMARKVVKENSSQGREVNERKADINTLWDKLKVELKLHTQWSRILRG